MKTCTRYNPPHAEDDHRGIKPKRLAAFQALLAKSIADALVAQIREEAAAQGVDVWTWLERQGKGQG